MNITTSQKDKNVAISAWYLLASNGIAAASTWVFMIIAGRYLSVADYGMFAAGWTILNLLTSMSTSGLSLSAVKYIPEYLVKDKQESAKTVLLTSYRITITASLLLGFIFFINADFISERIYSGGLTTVFKTVALMLPLSSLMTITLGATVGIQNTKLHLLINTGGSALKLLTLPFLLLIAQITGLFLSIAVGLAASFIIGIILTRKVINFRLIEIITLRDKSVTKKIISYSLPLLGAAISSYLLTQGGIAILGALSDKEATGLFTAGITLIFPFYLLSGPISTIMVLVYSKLWISEQKEKIIWTHAKFMRYLLYIMLPLLAIYISVPRSILSVVYGIEYASASNSLRFLAIGAFIYLAYAALSSFLYGIGKTMDLLYSILTGSIVFIVLIITLSPSYGITGAGIASMLSWLTTIILCFFQVRKYIYLKLLYKDTIPLFTAFLTMLVVTVSLRSIAVGIWGLLIFIAIGLTIYAVMLILQRAIKKKEDVNLINSIVNVNSIKKIFGHSSKPEGDSYK